MFDVLLVRLVCGVNASFEKIDLEFLWAPYCVVGFCVDAARLVLFSLRGFSHSLTLVFVLLFWVRGGFTLLTSIIFVGTLDHFGLRVRPCLL